MSEPIKQIIRFCLLILVQSMVLSHMPPVSMYVTPYLYFLFLIWLPFYMSRGLLLVLGFITGFALDMFTKTPGLHASACLMLVYVRPLLVNILVPRETKELNIGSPSIRTMGFSAYAIYVVLLTLVHHIWLVMLEWMYFGDILFFFAKVLFTTLISVLLITITEMLFRPIKKWA